MDRSIRTSRIFVGAITAVTDTIVDARGEDLDGFVGLIFTVEYRIRAGRGSWNVGGSELESKD